VFGGNGWDEGQKARLSAALAGLNMTGVESLNKRDKTFHNLVQAIQRKCVDEVAWGMMGVWFIRPEDEDSLRDETGGWNCDTAYSKKKKKKFSSYPNLFFFFFPPPVILSR
jgi:hypothetical protein